MSIRVPSQQFTQSNSPADNPSFIVGQDAEGHWLAAETHGLGSRTFATKADALAYATSQTNNRPGGVRLAGAFAVEHDL